MSSKDRIQRIKDDTRINILNASLDIAKRDGWTALSMRKIADAIDYTAPIIYEYFANKEALLLELTKRGYLILTRYIREAKSLHQSPAMQLEAMWFSYWDFAFENKAFYQLMFGVEISPCHDLAETLPESKEPFNQFREVIINLMHAEQPSPEIICLKYYTFWSLIHGLISINIIQRAHSAEQNNHILKEAISTIIKSIEKAA